MRNVFRYANNSVIPSKRPAPDLSPARSEDLYVDIGGARLRYRDEGEGPALLLLHGWALDLDMWEPQAAALSAAYRIVRVDRRGFGLSSGEPSLVDDVSDVQTLCRHLRLQRTALLGTSQGARVALHVASVSPGMISCLILDGSPRIGAAAGRRDPQELPYEDFRHLAQTQGMTALRREWMRHPLAQLKTGGAEARELLARMVARYPGKDLIDPVARPTLTTTAEMIRSIAPPVLVIGGALDIDSRRRIAQELVRELPHAERAEIPDAGHLCNLDNPQAYTSALRSFLEHHAIAQNHH
jgi:3-oxoadipate enol-lactonase